VGRHRDRGPGVDADPGQRLPRIRAAVGDPGQRRRLDRPLGPDQRGLEPGLRAEAGDGQRGRVGPDHGEAGDRLVQAAHQERIVGGDADLVRAAGAGLDAALGAVGAPDRRAALGHELEEPRHRGVAGQDALDQDLDARAAEELDVRPRAAGAVHQLARFAVGQGVGGVDGDVALDAAAGEEARHQSVGEHHLGAGRARAAALDAVEGDQRRRLAGLQRALERRADVLGEAERRPDGQAEIHGWRGWPRRAPRQGPG